MGVKLGLILRKGHRLTVFYNIAVLFGYERNKFTKDWSKIHNDELHYLFFSTNIKMIKSNKMRWEGHEALMANVRNA